jgi:Flp pilus assembly protein TadD
MATASQVSKAVLHGNAGLLRFSQQDYSGALEDFEAAAAADPTDSAAVNNAAICQLLSTQVGAATSSGLHCIAVMCRQA